MGEGREDLRIGPILAFLLNSKERLRKPWERAVQAFNITLEAILEGDQHSVYQVSKHASVMFAFILVGVHLLMTCYTTEQYRVIPSSPVPSAIKLSQLNVM